MMPAPDVPTTNVVDRARIELAATALQVQHSTPELPAHAFFSSRGCVSYCILVFVADYDFKTSFKKVCPKRARKYIFLGGDPAAGSPTATLLRLNPSHKPYVRCTQLTYTSRKAHSNGLTGGVCKEQGRFHRTVSCPSQEFLRPRLDEVRLLGIPSSRG